MLAAVEFDVILVPHVMEAIKTNFPQTWSMKNKNKFLLQWFNNNNMYQFHMLILFLLNQNELLHIFYQCKVVEDTRYPLMAAPD